jgi:ribulose-phosphate 3-epimerase
MQQALRQRLVAPSVLSADFGRLAAEVAQVMEAGARLIHFDVMDGSFVPNITIGPAVVATLAPLVHERGGLVDVHLMIDRPEAFVERFAAAGADAISLHQEACRHLHRSLAQIRECGPVAGVALNPATPIETLAEARHFCDFVLVMSVNPGFGGQSYIPTSTAKLQAARAYLPEEVAIEVDGGVGVDNIAQIAGAGANWLVAGSSVFGGGDSGTRFRALQEALG